MQIELRHDWYDCTFDDVKAIGALIGFDIDNIYFSGFWSQGDGACFAGSLSYRKGCQKAVRKYAPQDTELHAIADAWAAAQRPLFYRASGTVKHSGHYNHEFCTSFAWEHEGREYGELSANEEETLQDVARDFMRWIYRQLEREYEYQYAWEAARQWQEARDEMIESRSNARALVAEMRQAIRDGMKAGDTICSALRAQLRRYFSDWEKARETRDDIASDFHYWRDGKSLDVEQFANEYV